MPDPSTPCRQVTPEMFLEWPACRAGGLQPSSTPLDTPRHTSLNFSNRFCDHLTAKREIQKEGKSTREIQKEKWPNETLLSSECA
jgi:hypothetical protein